MLAGTVERPLLLAATLSLLSTTVVLVPALGQPTPCFENCAELRVGVGSPLGADAYRVPISFLQAPSDGVPGQGADEVAVLTFSLSIPGLRLKDCSDVDADGRTPSIGVPASIADNFTVFVENTSCAGREHCLCPGEGQVRDEYLNVMIYGPKTLPAPALGGLLLGGPLHCDPDANGSIDFLDLGLLRREPFRPEPGGFSDCNADGLVGGPDVTALLRLLAGGPIDVPLLPNGEILSLELEATPDAEFPIGLHVYSETDIPMPKPPFTALAAIGDRAAIDATANRATNQSLLHIVDGRIDGGIAGDCDGDAETAITELQLCANIFLGELLEACRACDVDRDGEVDITDLQGAVNCFLDAESIACPRA